jgi:hypothetical protein
MLFLTRFQLILWTYIKYSLISKDFFTKIRMGLRNKVKNFQFTNKKIKYKRTKMRKEWKAENIPEKKS